MYRGFKRLLSKVMILVIVVSVGTIPIEAIEIMDKQKDEANGTECYLSNSWYVASGYYYRFKASAYLYVDGKYVESTSDISRNIYH